MDTIDIINKIDPHIVICWRCKKPCRTLIPEDEITADLTFTCYPCLVKGRIEDKIMLDIHNAVESPGIGYTGKEMNTNDNSTRHYRLLRSKFI